MKAIAWRERLSRTAILPYECKCKIRNMPSAFTASIFLTLMFVAPAFAQQPDLCSKQGYSNAEMRHCYSKEKSAVDAEINSLVARIAEDFRRSAKQFPGERNDVIAQCSLRAASKVEQSQAAWKKYRQLHCGAIADSYTTGSGAGTAYEECAFRVGTERLKELRASFSLGSRPIAR